MDKFLNYMKLNGEDEDDYYDDEYYTAVVNSHMSDDIDEVFADAAVFDLNRLKQDYPCHLDRPYNAVIIIGRMKYEGEIKEIQNDEFGYFKFLGAYPEPLPDQIRDTSKMYKYATHKLTDWGYRISVTTEKGRTWHYCNTRIGKTAFFYEKALF